MKWLLDLIQARDSPRPILDKKDDPAKGETIQNDEEEEETDEDLGPVEVDQSDDKPSLQFGTLRKGGEKSLLGFCEVRQQGAVEACEWRVATLGPKQKTPAYKIRF